MIRTVLIAWVATVGFAIVFNIPRKDLFFAGLCGAAGWAVYFSVNKSFESPYLAAFSGALVVGILGEILARWLRKPVTVYVIPGILPLVPGYGLYRAMERIILREYSNAADIGFQTMLIALAISSGIIIASSVGKFINERNSRKAAKKPVVKNG